MSPRTSTEATVAAMPCAAVIPAHRAERTIGAALESLRVGNAAAVDRVVVVTSSGDPTADVVRRWQLLDPGVELVTAPQRWTAGAARNAGREALRHACREDAAPPPVRLLFIDADCRLETGGAARLETELVRRGAAAVSARVLGGTRIVDRVRHILEFKEAASRRPPPLAWLPPSTTMLCRADAFDEVGGFPDLWPGEDLVFSQSLRDSGRIVARSDEVSTFHDHPPGLGAMLRHQFRLGFTAAVARRRRAMPGSGLAHRPWRATLLLPGRALRILAWQAGEGASALAWTLLLSPLLGAGLLAWTTGFVSSAAARGGERDQACAQRPSEARRDLRRGAAAVEVPAGVPAS
ncbi:MAG: glycosyltransferase family 2 protein [Candidatus Binatia bacterium]